MHMIASRSGQSAGILLRNWTPLVPARFALSSSGLLFLMAKLANDPKNSLKRVFLASGEAIDSRERLAVSMDGSKVRDVYLPEWMVFDVLFANADGRVRTLSFVSSSTKEKNNISCRHSVFIGGVESKTLSWKDFPLLAGKFGLEELWHRITGVVKPSWGSFAGEEGALYVADCNSHAGVLSDDFGDCVPPGFDVLELGRIETMLQSMGVELRNAERSIEETCAILGSLDCSKSEWLSEAENIVAAERKRGGTL